LKKEMIEAAKKMEPLEAQAEGEEQRIEVEGARVHNLKNIDVSIPRQSLTVITGLSGSGKSSLAFDTLFAEGQRRYLETFSAYARNFLGNLERPDVDKISGLSPVISIEQKTTNKNPRSTVGTTTEINDFLRLLFARAGKAYSYVTGEEMVRYTEEQIIDLILHDYEGQRVLLLAPLVRNRKGHYRELFDTMRRKGFLYVRIDGEVRELTMGLKVDRYKNHDIELVVDKLAVSVKDDQRLRQSVATAMSQGNGLMMIYEPDSGHLRYYSKRLMCPTSGISYSDPAPHNFSFNSPQGACPRCKGLGIVSQIDIDKVIPDRSLSVYEGAIAPLGSYKNQMIFWEIAALLEKYEATVKTPVSELDDEVIQQILYGCDERLRIRAQLVHTSSDYFVNFEGLVKYIQQMQSDDMSASAQKWADQFARVAVCPECGGARLNKEALHFRIWDKNIAELCRMDVSELYDWTCEVESHLSDRQRNQRLIGSLKELRDLGNTVIVVEHDRDMMLAADYVVDLGPKAGRKGGEEVSSRAHRKRCSRRTPSPLISQWRETGHRDCRPQRRKAMAISITIHGASGQQPETRRREVSARHTDRASPACRDRASRRSSTRPCSPSLSQRFYRSLQEAYALRQHRGHRQYRQGGQRRPEPYRTYATLQPRHLHGRVQRHPQSVCGTARG
jgi:excinuclease UvrABC ATPase subunit